MTRVTITDNIVSRIDVAPLNGDGRGFLINNDPIDLVIAHNTVLDPTNSGDHLRRARRPSRRRGSSFRDNVIDAGQYGVKGPGLGTLATLAAFMPLGGFAGNVIVTTDPSAVLAGNWFAARAAVGFTSTLQLAPTSPYRLRASDGRDPGANVAAVLAAIVGVVQP
jgi:hypothetical protein